MMICFVFISVDDDDDDDGGHNLISTDPQARVDLEGRL